MKKEIGIVIKEARKYRMLKQDFMAYKLRITTKGYANIEAGRVDVNCKKLQDIALILEVKAQYIFTLAEELNDNNKVSWILSLIREKIRLYCASKNIILISPVDKQGKINPRN